MYNYSKEKLSNNIRYITVPSVDAESVAIAVMVKLGSRYETPKVAGGAHYIEHLMFKGTEKRPSTLILSKELDAIGARYNAFTGKEYTVYYIHAAKKHFDKICDIIFDMVNNSLFNEEEMQREKKVIIEEIKMYEDNPIMHIGELYESIAYNGSTLGLDIAGTRDSVANMNRQDVLDLKQSAYSSENVIVTLVGGIDDQVTKTFKELFNGYSNVGEPKVKYNKFEVSQTKPQLKLLNRKMEQAQIMLGFPALPEGHDDLPALELLSVILGGNMSSRLFINIRENKGLCYSIRSSCDAYQDTGSFKVTAAIDKDRIYEAIPDIIKELDQVVQDGVTDQELQRAQDYIEGRLILSLEDHLEQGFWFGMQELELGKIKTPEEKIAEFKAVTLEQIQNIAKTIFNKQLINLAVIGPFEDEKKFMELL